MRRIAGALTAIAAAAVIGGLLAGSGGARATASAHDLPVGTAEVQRRTLTAMISQGGTLGYRGRPDGSPYSVINQAHGTYTALPALGQVVGDGRVLYRVDGRAVVLLYGSTPAFRTLAAGSAGPDVAQLNADLAALGYATGPRLRRRSAAFGAATTAAVRRLQAALGLPRTGVLALGEVVFQPSALRVTDVSALLGGGAAPGATVLQGTSTARQVQVALDASQQASLAVGNRVRITLPDNRTSPGVVSSVARVATCSSTGGTGGSGSPPGAAGADACSAGGPGASAPTITVDVTPSDPAATGSWDTAPVQVGITTATVRDALVVPVTALLAQAGGGYAVEIVSTGAAHRLAPVSVGLFDDADGLVQITGSGLAAGQRIVVPTT